MKSCFLIALVLIGFAVSAEKPNIVLILADDIGYGDVSCYGATKVKTPNVDKLAEQGLRFTSGYAPSATCTPSRYAMLTGEYAFRKKGTNILPGNAALIIDPSRTTLPSVLRQAGYTTGVVGKWHLGLGSGEIDWNGEIKPGPNEIGFDHSFIIPATGDRTPCVFVENRRVVNLDPKDPIQVSYGKPIGDEPTGKDHPEMLTMKLTHGHDQTIVNGISRIGYMSGGKAARWKDENIADTLTKQAVAFLERSKDKPFFLYFATHDIHVPRVPNQRFVGKTEMGPRGDAIVEFDWSVGEIMAALDRLGLTNNTLVVLSSDNGPVVNDGYADDSIKKLGEHKPAGPLRGGKYSSFEGGTRVPFLTRWPGKIKPGVSDEIVSLVDFTASFAALTEQTLTGEAAPDSLNVLPSLLGTSNGKPGRDHIVEHAGALSIRKGDWKYIPARKQVAVSKDTNIETGGHVQDQLYDLSKDIGEKTNVAEQHPEKVRELDGMLKEIVQKGQTR